MPHIKLAENVSNSEKLLKTEISRTENTTDRQLPINSIANIPQMELLKVNYVHQCKEAIMHKPKNILAAPRRFDEYRRPPYELKRLKGKNVTSQPIEPKLIQEKYENPPTVQSWQLLLQSVNKNSPLLKYSPQEHTFTSNCSCNIADYGSDSSEGRSPYIDYKKSRNRECNHSNFLTNKGIKSRADRIALIESEESFLSSRTNLQSRIPIPISHYKSNQVIHNCEHTPKWMFQNSKGACDTSNTISYAPHWRFPCFRQIPKLNRIHIQKKRQSLLIKNSLVNEKAWHIKQDQELEYDDQPRCKNISDFTYECATDKNTCLKDNPAFRCLSPNNCTKKEQKNTKRDNFLNIHLMRDKDNFESLNISSQIKSHGDPNDLQNFAKKDLRKLTTNELIQAVTEKTKQCNIDIEKKLNDMKVREEETYSTSSWINESLLDDNDQMVKNIETYPSFPKHTSKDTNDLKCVNHFKETSLDQFPETSLCTSSSNISNYDNISLCASDHRSRKCKIKYYSQFGNCNSHNSINKKCNTIEGVFWNSSYNEFSTEIAYSTCCSLSSCDEDNCSCCSTSITSLPKQQESKQMHQNENRKYTNTKKSKVGIIYKINDDIKTRPKSSECEDIISMLPNVNHGEVQMKNKQFWHYLQNLDVYREISLALLASRIRNDWSIQ
ncbi:uncharacterized protein LOC6496680 isoform X10 [Drosophila ananassae]|uniref:uncharacterized protein LOC6496680 isoform X10 n=1 Tax=Drosophila ananassae TaxID=7217 RepID=UPI001CFFE930|nr:uncharacterized protein LOC6496680 isoform X10 [Drosophila ananassae]